MDSLTARHLARELDARWRGARLGGSVLDRDARMVVLAVERTPAVCFDLADPEVPVREAPAPPHGGPLAGWTVRGVSAPEDDRRLVIELGRPGKFRGSAERRATLEISAVPTARGALLRDAGGATLGAVAGRLPKPAVPRPLPTPEEVADAAARGDVDAMLRWRWVSVPVARWLAREPERAGERYRMLAGDEPARPARCGDHVVPFPWCDEAEPVGSLIQPAAPAGEPRAAPGTREGRALARMRAELANASAAPQVREAADALAARGDEPAPRSVVLASGASVAVHPRQGESSIAAAERLYGAARSMERALERLPERIERLAREEAARPAEPSTTRLAGRGGTRRRGAAPAPPYRAYLSSGGLEIWVGRGAAHNDALTFHAAAPDDVWLHARDAAGAHVVLRWRREEPPPARDLEEAALLAAWHSRSRGATVVPVDWTRRKWVRKPHGAAPGLVTLQRAETVFVRPERERLRRLMDRS